MFELLDDFNGEIKRALADIVKALEAKDPVSAGQHAHKIKGGAGNLMCCGLANACKAMETLGLEYEDSGSDKVSVIKKQAAELGKIQQQVRLFTEMVKRRKK